MPEMKRRRYLLTEDQIKTIRSRCKRYPEVIAALNLQEACDNRPDRDFLIDSARAAYGGDEVEIDDDASLSPTDEGCWVQGWLWVPYAPTDDDLHSIPKEESSDQHQS